MVLYVSSHLLLQDDLVAGLTVGVMAIPQGVSFAAMAGLPAKFGLYTAFVPVLVYCFFGGSRHLVRIPLPSPSYHACMADRQPQHAREATCSMQR